VNDADELVEVSLAGVAAALAIAAWTDVDGVVPPPVPGGAVESPPPPPPQLASARAHSKDALTRIQEFITFSLLGQLALATLQVCSARDTLIVDYRIGQTMLLQPIMGVDPDCIGACFFASCEGRDCRQTTDVRAPEK
jgi:hypothetical protein